MYEKQRTLVNSDEKMFFSSYLKITIAEKLFYKLDRDFYAYILKVLIPKSDLAKP
jgi:hypothetical protein